MVGNRGGGARLAWPGLLLVLLASACGHEAQEKLRDCQDEVQRLEFENKRLESEVTRLENRAASLEQEVKETRSRMIASRMGIRGEDTELVAVLDTDKGTVRIKLHWLLAPYNVQNFVELAEGTREWVDSSTGKRVKRPLYDGTIFHRVVPDFIIQGGDPTGTGKGGPGYTIPDEFDPRLKFNKAGVVAMANTGPNTNGSQFFITLGPHPDLNDKYTIIGEVVEGMDVVKAIGSGETDDEERPLHPVTLRKVTIERIEHAGDGGAGH